MDHMGFLFTFPQNPNIAGIQPRHRKGLDGPTERASGWLCLRKMAKGTATWSGHAGHLEGGRCGETVVEPGSPW